MEYNSFVLDGHSGLVIPVPISNTEVKQVYVLGGTVLVNGNPRKLSTFFFNKKKYEQDYNSCSSIKAFL